MSATSLCFYCANPQTPERPLVWDVNGQRSHDLYPRPPADRATDGEWDAALVPCPSVPTGFAACAQCSHAVPVSDAYVAECRIQLAPTYRQSWTAPTKYTEPFWERHDSAPAGGTIEADEQTRGVIVERDAVGRLYALCTSCAERWPEDAKRRRYRTSASSALSTTEPDSDESLAARVPADGADVEHLMKLWGKADRATRDAARRLVASGLLATIETPTRAGGAPKKTYVKASS